MRFNKPALLKAVEVAIEDEGYAAFNGIASVYEKIIKREARRDVLEFALDALVAEGLLKVSQRGIASITIWEPATPIPGVTNLAHTTSMSDDRMRRVPQPDFFGPYDAVNIYTHPDGRVEVAVYRQGDLVATAIGARLNR